MTGDASRSEKGLSVAFSILMVVSMMAIGGAAFAGSATATEDGSNEAVVVEDITVGESSTTQTVELQNISDDGTGDTLNLTHNDIGGSGEYNFTGVSLESLGDLNVTNVEVAGDADVGITIGTDTEAVEDNITLSLTVDTTGVSSSGAIDDTDYDLDDDDSKLATVTGSFTLLDTDEPVQLFDTDDNLIYTSGNIQPAIDEASADQRIEVASGTYDNGPVVINDAAQDGLTLEGPNADTNGDGDRSDEALIGGPVAIYQDNVTVTGFNITDKNLDTKSNGYPGDGSAAVQIGTIGGEPQNVTLSNNIIYPESTDNIGKVIGIGFEGADNLTIEGNLITGDGYAKYTFESDVQDLEISNNRFETPQYTTLGFPDGGDLTATVRGNVFNQSPLYIETNSEVNITDNEFSGDAKDGVEAIFIDSNFGSDDTLKINNNSFGDYTTGVNNNAKETVKATNNWWGATNGPSGDFDGNGTSVTGSVTVDPASVKMDTGSIDLNQNFIGTVNDPQNVTLNGSSDAEFSFDADVPGEVDGTLVLDIGGTEFVFKDVLDEGEINTTIGPDDADDSGKNGTSIAVSEGTGDRNVSVAGFDSAAAVEQAGTTKLIHVAKAAPNAGYFVTSMPQSGKFHEQGVDDVTQYDGNADANEEEYSNFDASNDVASVNRALFINAESEGARYGYTFDTDRSDQPTDFGSVRLSTGWHVLGSNFNVSQSDEVEIQNDLQTQTAVDTSDLNVYPSTNPDGTGSFSTSTKVSEYEAYYVYVHSEDNRPVFLPEYDPDADKNTAE